MKGSVQPMKFFTIDVDPSTMRPMKDKFHDMGKKEKKEARTVEKKSLLDKIFMGKK